jgi:hypothetical protein
VHTCALPARYQQQVEFRAFVDGRVRHHVHAFGASHRCVAFGYEQHVMRPRFAAALDHFVDHREDLVRTHEIEFLRVVEDENSDR